MSFYSEFCIFCEVALKLDSLLFVDRSVADDEAAGDGTVCLAHSVRATFAINTCRSFWRHAYILTTAGQYSAGDHCAIRNNCAISNSCATSD